MSNRFYTVETESKKQFFQLPKVFMLEDSKYFNMHPMAKMTYAILEDRNRLSIKNGWIDKQGRIFFLFNQKNLCRVLGIKDSKTLRKYLIELEKKHSDKFSWIKQTT